MGKTNKYTKSFVEKCFGWWT